MYSYEHTANPPPNVMSIGLNPPNHQYWGGYPAPPEGLGHTPDGLNHSSAASSSWQQQSELAQHQQQSGGANMTTDIILQCLSLLNIPYPHLSEHQLFFLLQGYQELKYLDQTMIMKIGTEKIHVWDLYVKNYVNDRNLKNQALAAMGQHRQLQQQQGGAGHMNIMNISPNHTQPSGQSHVVIGNNNVIPDEEKPQQPTRSRLNGAAATFNPSSNGGMSFKNINAIQQQGSLDGRHSVDGRHSDMEMLQQHHQPSYGNMINNNSLIPSLLRWRTFVLSLRSNRTEMITKAVDPSAKLMSVYGDHQPGTLQIPAKLAEKWPEVAGICLIDRADNEGIGKAKGSVRHGYMQGTYHSANNNNIGGNGGPTTSQESTDWNRGASLMSDKMNFKHSSFGQHGCSRSSNIYSSIGSGGLDDNQSNNGYSQQENTNPNVNAKEFVSAGAPNGSNALYNDGDLGGSYPGVGGDVTLQQQQKHQQITAAQAAGYERYIGASPNPTVQQVAAAQAQAQRQQQVLAAHAAAHQQRIVDQHQCDASLRQKAATQEAFMVQSGAGSPDANSVNLITNNNLLDVNSHYGNDVFVQSLNQPKNDGQYAHLSPYIEQPYMHLLNTVRKQDHMFRPTAVAAQQRQMAASRQQQVGAVAGNSNSLQMEGDLAFIKGAYFIMVGLHASITNFEESLRGNHVMDVPAMLLHLEKQRLQLVELNQWYQMKVQQMGMTNQVAQTAPNVRIQPHNTAMYMNQVPQSMGTVDNSSAMIHTTVEDFQRGPQKETFYQTIDPLNSTLPIHDNVPVDVQRFLSSYCKLIDFPIDFYFVFWPELLDKITESIASEAKQHMLELQLAHEKSELGRSEYLERLKRIIINALQKSVTTKPDRIADLEAVVTSSLKIYQGQDGSKLRQNVRKVGSVYICNPTIEMWILSDKDKKYRGPYSSATMIEWSKSEGQSPAKLKDAHSVGVLEDYWDGSQTTEPKVARMAMISSWREDLDEAIGCSEISEQNLFALIPVKMLNNGASRVFQWLSNYDAAKASRIKVDVSSTELTKSGLKTTWSVGPSAFKSTKNDNTQGSASENSCGSGSYDTDAISSSQSFAVSPAVEVETNKNAGVASTQINAPVVQQRERPWNQMPSSNTTTNDEGGVTDDSEESPKGEYPPRRKVTNSSSDKNLPRGVWNRKAVDTITNNIPVSNNVPNQAVTFASLTSKFTSGGSQSEQTSNGGEQGWLPVKGKKRKGF